MNRRWVRILAVVAVLALPLAIHWGYRQFTALPQSVRIATGPQHGRYRELMECLARTLEEEHGVDVELVHTQGSRENLALLEEGTVDLAIVQAGTRPEGDDDSSTGVTFVANLYREVVHLLVRRGESVQSPADLEGKRVAVGQPRSGDRTSSEILLQHFGLSLDDVDARPFDYAQIVDGFGRGDLDAAVVTTSTDAPILEALLVEGVCDVQAVPYVAALAEEHLWLSEHRIPAGAYRTQPPVEPAEDVLTVATRAQLLGRNGARTPLVSVVTKLVTGEDFVKRNGLSELFREGHAFARRKPDFAIHPAATHVYNPELKPPISSEFVEATEGLRSFLVSILVGGFLYYRWWKQRRIRNEEHKLDRYVHELLEIERRQTQLDQRPGADECQRLQELLDEVTALRQKALQDFSAHDLREDRATDCFLEMCHALSDKINAKLTRQRTDVRFRELTEALQQATRPTTEEATGA